MQTTKHDLEMLSNYHRASKLKSAGQFTEAEKKFREIIDTTELYHFEIIAGAYFHIGEIYLQTHRCDEAVEAFTNAVTFNPSHYKAGQYLINQYSALPQFPLPFFLTMDVSGICNLTCPYCPQGQKLHEQPKKVMKIEEFKKMIGPILKNLKRIEFANWSEPLLNPDLFKIIRFSLQKKPGLILGISSNGMLLSEELSEMILSSGIMGINITISGLTNRIHQRYHVGSDIKKLLQNIKKLLQLKLKKGTGAAPAIIITYLEFEYNRIEFDILYKSICKLLGSDNFRLDKFTGCLMGTTLKQGYREANTRKSLHLNKAAYLKDRCFLLFFNPAIRCDGAIFPCCAVHYDPELILGDLKEQTFYDAWNSKRWSTFRKTFIRGTNKTCSHCRFYYPDN